jgi:thioredoxin 1
MLNPRRTVFTQVQNKYATEKLPLLLCFSATWCSHCQSQKPALSTIEKGFAGKISFKRLDFDEEKDLATAAGIKIIPAFVFISKDRSRGGMLLGQQSEDQLRSFLKQALAL